MAAVASVVSKERRTQAERSATTRWRLLDAAIECLHDLGYARTSTPEIARRAGLSRGAQLHHFPTKAELVTSAIERLFERRREEFLRAFAARPAGSDPCETAIDILWSMVSGPTFYVWLELVVAARTDPELKEPVQELTERLEGIVATTFRELFPEPAEPNPFYGVAPRFAFALLDGLAVERLNARDTTAHEAVLVALKALARMVMPTGAPASE
ncbi:MAG TPA: TetR/AcrR family transcriptional regulator [Candidatus Eisenbacteria bacterium]|nr:TetR/AcrR family transcriptional regulator [Candidatus Eisenbacteria bacterium]